MTCSECGERLQQWLDGRTPPADPLALCPACVRGMERSGRRAASTAGSAR